MQDSQREDYSYQKGRDSNKPGLFSNLNKGQKIAASSLAVFACLILVFWALQFQKTLISPFNVSNDQATNNSVDSQNTDNQDLALKSKDTDGDGLSDWDEINQYKTSPYLSDSDSDGFDDKTEIDNGKDPNCPIGRDCNVSGVVEGDISLTTTGTTTADALPDYLRDAINAQTSQNQTGQTAQNKSTNLSDSELLNQIMDGTIDPASLRQLLIDRGVKKEVLDKISDEQLISNMKETVKNNAASAANTTNSAQ
jgi:hypothetical protein